jgi:hypothetical protein
MEQPQGLKRRCSFRIGWTTVVQSVLLLGYKALDPREGGGNQRSDDLCLLCWSAPPGPGG